MFEERMKCLKLTWLTLAETDSLLQYAGYWVREVCVWTLLYQHTIII